MAHAELFAALQGVDVLPTHNSWILSMCHVVIFSVLHFHSSFLIACVTCGAFIFRNVGFDVEVSRFSVVVHPLRFALLFYT
jgi:hypothetical protein